MNHSRMHESYERLLQAAKAAGYSEPGPAAIGKALGESTQAVKNWESRGVSASGAISAELRFNVSPSWLLYGSANSLPAANVPKTLSGAMDVMLSALEGRSAYRAEQIADALVRFATGRASKAEVTADLLQWLTEPRGRESGADAHTSAPPRRLTAQVLELPRRPAPQRAAATPARSAKVLPFRPRSPNER